MRGREAYPPPSRLAVLTPHCLHDEAQLGKADGRAERCLLGTEFLSETRHFGAAEFAKSQN